MCKKRCKGGGVGVSEKEENWRVWGSWRDAIAVKQRKKEKAAAWQEGSKMFLPFPWALDKK